MRCLWVPAFSACSMALDGVLWVQGGLVETAVGRLDQPHATESAPSPAPSLGQCSARELVSASYYSNYATLNAVPCRSMACIMIASRRANAIRALRMVERR